MKFIAQPDGVYLVLRDGEATLLPGVTYDAKTGRVDASALPVELAVDGVVVERAKELRVESGVQLVVLEDDTTVAVEDVNTYVKETGASRVDATKEEIEASRKERETKPEVKPSEKRAVIR